MKKARDVKAMVIAIVIAFAMAVIMPFSGVKAEGSGNNVKVITQKDFDDAMKNPGTAKNGITYVGDGEFEFAAGSYKLGGDIFTSVKEDGDYYYYLNFYIGSFDFDFGSYTIGDNASIYIYIQWMKKNRFL